MLIEDFLNQSIDSKSLNRCQKPAAQASFVMALNQVSAQAADDEAAPKVGGYFTESATEPTELELQFKAYMDKVTGRVPSPPKTPEEKIKELTEKIKNLQAQLSEVIDNSSLSEGVKNDRVTDLTAQINAAYAQLADLGQGACASEE